MSTPEPDQSAAGQPTRAGVIGLGMIGSGVAASLANRGIRPVVYDLRPEAAEALAEVADPAASAAQVARESDVVLISVYNARQAMAVLAGADGVLSAARDGLIVALLSTVTLRELRELAAACAEAGVSLIDAGVSGGTGAASNGLVVMAGGPDDVVERARPVLEGFGGLVVHCGPLGAGMATKLARNAFSYSVWAAAREAATLAAAGGVPLDRLYEVLEACASAGHSDPLLWLRREVEGRPITPEHADFIDGLAQKDMGAAQELAGETGVEVPIANVARPRMRPVFGGPLLDPLPEEANARGRAMMDRIYGDGFSSRLPDDDSAPWSTDTIEHLFARIWSRPHLTLRDRRLLAIGAVAMMGNPNPITDHVGGALASGDLTLAQAREIALFLPYYAGWINATPLKNVIGRLVAEAAGAERPVPPRPAVLREDPQPRPAR
jgi:3-hydroxyisobutyrate dehydrogenase-like beta-hydroxyacid dehydrogenase/alkylhydroperoxidase/carboxymuconolactone decarboxylase family protein YurZ